MFFNEIINKPQTAQVGVAGSTQHISGGYHKNFQYLVLEKLYREFRFWDVCFLQPFILRFWALDCPFQDVRRLRIPILDSRFFVEFRQFRRSLKTKNQKQPFYRRTLFLLDSICNFYSVPFLEYH